MNKSALANKIRDEIEDYKNSSKEMLDGYNFSAWKLLRRIGLYKAQVYPKGKTDSQGNYKYWFDIITPRVNSEVKNVDFDTKDILLYTDTIKTDAPRLLIANVALKDDLDNSGEAEKLNEAVEQGSEWGNVIWKETTDGYKILELNNVMVLNQTSKSLKESDVIEYECMLSSDIRKKKDVWENVDELIKSAKVENNKSPEFYIYERNGEISEKDYFNAKGKDGGDEDKYILVKAIVGGVEKDKPTLLLFCEEITEKPYKEYHRSSYTGTWLRRGLYEILMDIQTRANEIGNQIARGLDTKKIYRSSDRLIAQNIMTDMQDGDIIKSGDLQQIDTRIQGLDQLIADWNRLMELADKLANSYEVVTGESSPSGTPFRLAAQQNLNANKLFGFIREKLSNAFQEVVKKWILPKVLKNLKSKEIIRLTSDSGALNRYYEMLVDGWYIKNLLAFPPHNEEQAKDIKMQKLQELVKNKEEIVKLEKDMWKEFYPKVKVSITGENYALAEELDTINSFIALEQDPLRRSYLIEMAMQKKGIDVSSLPRTPVAPPPQSQNQNNNGLDQMLNQQSVAMQ